MTGDCHIYATGVSINDYNILSIKSGFRIGVGFSHANKKIPKDFFDCYLDADPPSSYRKAYGKKYVNFYRSLDENINKEGALIFLHVNARKVVEKLGLFSGRNVYYLSTSSLFNAEHVECNIVNRMPMIQGSISMAMLVSIYMGFDRIFLHGAGYSYSPMQYFHFYEEYPDMRQVLIERNIPFPTNYCDIIHKTMRITDSSQIASIISDFENETGLHCSEIKKINGHNVPRFVRHVEEDNMMNHKIINEYANNNGVSIFSVATERCQSSVYRTVSVRQLSNE